MMTWLRIDDGFPEHPKLVALGKPADRWTWLELLAYCARRTTNGVVPAGIDDVLRRVTPSFLKRCENVGLLDRDDCGKLVVHDWKIYNGATLEDRVLAFLAANPDATANEVHRSTRGNRQAVLGLYAEFQRFRSGSETGSQSGTGSVLESSERFRGVVPTPAPTPTKAFDSEVDLEAGLALDPARASLPDPQKQHDPSDPVAALLHELHDADHGTELILRKFALPEYAYRQAIEEVRANGRKTALAVTILRRISDEITAARDVIDEVLVATPDDSIPF